VIGSRLPSSMALRGTRTDRREALFVVPDIHVRFKSSPAQTRLDPQSHVMSHKAPTGPTVSNKSFLLYLSIPEWRVCIQITSFKPCHNSLKTGYNITHDHKFQPTYMLILDPDPARGTAPNIGIEPIRTSPPSRISVTRATTAAGYPLVFISSTKASALSRSPNAT